MSGSDAHRDEAARLRAIAAELAHVVDARDAPELPEPDGSLAADNRLQAYVSTIRTWYLRGLANITASRWRTPPTGEQIPFPGASPGTSPGTPTGYDYAYDRQHPPEFLEARLRREPAPTGVLLCASGMAALAVIFHGLGHLLSRTRRLVAFASYFETLTLLRIGPFAGRWQRAMSEPELAETLALGDVEVVVIEPVQYAWSLATSDWSALLEALARLAAPPVVVVDTTLSGDCDAQDVLLERLRERVPLLVRVRSGLKLDQQGLELANLGVVEWWATSDSPRFEALHSVLSACRVVTGATLCWPDACALAPGFVLRSGDLRDYSAGVSATNRALHEAVEASAGLFCATVHPPRPWPAPFVLYELADGRAEDYRLLAALLKREQARRGLSWGMSGSFGFRTARYETILPKEQLRPGEPPQGVLKVAAGRYRGARFQAIVELLTELSSFHTLDEVRRAWSKHHVAFEAER